MLLNVSGAGLEAIPTTSGFPGQMIKLEHSLKGMLLQRSLRSYVINGAMRMFVRPRFKSPPMPVAEMRKFLATHVEPRARFVAGSNISDEVMGDIPVRWFRSDKQRSDTLLIYLHGGAFVMETPRVHGAFISRLVDACGITGLMPSYRLAPEHPFPAAVEDCMQIYRSVLDSGIEPAKVIIAGDSAGGNLALVTLQQALATGLDMPSCAILISPGTELSGTDSQHSNARKDPMFNEHALDHVILYYLEGDKSLTSDPRVSPLKGNFEGLPPLFFMAGSTEIFRDCSVLAAHKAKEAGVDVTCHIWKSMPHCFPIMFAGWLPEAAEAINEITEFIEIHTGRET